MVVHISGKTLYEERTLLLARYAIVANLISWMILFLTQSASGVSTDRTVLWFLDDICNRKMHKVSADTIQSLVWIMAPEVASASCILTSSYGNASRVTGPRRGEAIFHRWIPITKDQ